MNIDTRVYAYIGDGYILCPGCAEREVAAGATIDQTGGHDGDLAPLGAYSGLFDRACGETCECGFEIAAGHDEDDDPCDECGWEPEPGV